MTNKPKVSPMLSVERELLERFVSDVEAHCYGFDGLEELRALLDNKPAGWLPCSPELLESGVDCAKAPRWSSKEWDGHSHWHPSPAVQHQGEPVAYWYVGDVDGYGCLYATPDKDGIKLYAEQPAPVAPFGDDTVVCRRYQLEQSPGQNFYHYDLEPVYGSVPVTLGELIFVAEGLKKWE